MSTSTDPLVVVHDETQPLLPRPNDTINDSQSQRQPWSTKKIITHTVLWSLALAVLVIFIKGFIDSDDVDFDLGKALKAALGGGLSGAAAMVLQVLTLMPLRTIMNYQYLHGTSLPQTTTLLYTLGGLPRFYSGLSFALLQGPLARFGDTAANAGILALLQGNKYLKNLPELGKTLFASLAAAGFRMILMPVDTVKTMLQTRGGKEGWGVLKERIRKYGVGTLWFGAFATAGATFVGHYPWFATYNYLSSTLPLPSPTSPHHLLLTLLRRALIGFLSSIASDTTSNSLRVLKTFRQVHDTKIG
ncbi:hypothetical protein H0H93_011917, partial [Arthromyces matolae]